MSSKQIQKLVLTTELEPLLDELGGHRNVKSYGEISSSITYEQRAFQQKEDYADLVIVQRALMIIDNTKERVAVVGRAETEVVAGGETPRITSGASILFSHSTEENAQKILNAKVDHRGITVLNPEKEADLVSANDVKAGYVFLVRIVRTELKKILSGKEPDKTVQILSIAEAMEALKDKEMERNFLSAATA